MPHRKTAFVVTLSCADQPGIVAAIASLLAEHGCNITDSAQFGDVKSGRFFMRVSFSAPPSLDREGARRMLAPVVERFRMTSALHPIGERMRVLILVSKFGHCLNDLLYRHRVGALKIDIPAIVSNHRDFYQLAASHDIPFHHLPVALETKEKQESRLAELIEEECIDLVVLARYMQVLSEPLCERLAGRAINIHHSFLPSFKGAKPYHQAHARGVKLIGATAHYVTPVLDEGPIIEQEVARVDHGMSTEDLVHMGRDVECLVLSRAVKWHVEHRVLLNGNRTVVFR
ncbi:MAG: formyltetrahydrofolate deformylase [Rhodomicrobium sp.]|jgi:formyltetrahydrofolate deformylase